MGKKIKRNSMTYYQSSFVWKRIDENTAARYFCLFDINSNKYAVQNTDFFYLPIQKNHIDAASRSLIELFIEIEPKERCEWFSTLMDAIIAHDNDFFNPLST